MSRVGTNMGLQTVTLRLLNDKCKKKKKSEREILPGNISRIKVLENIVCCLEPQFRKHTETKLPLTVTSIFFPPTCITCLNF